MPGIAEITISDLIFKFLNSKLLIIFTLDFLNFFFTLLKTFKSLMTKYFGLYLFICLQITEKCLFDDYRITLK